MAGIWTQLTPATTPTPSFASAICYDQANQNVVLFGGRNASAVLVNSTWIWDGTDWTLQSPGTSPSARSGHAMVFDPATGNVLLFGGRVAFNSYLDETWLWNSSDWTLLTPANSPSPREAFGLTYDADNGYVLLYGGVTSVSGGLENMSDETWAWDGSDWTLLTPAADPGELGRHGMAYDPNSPGTLIFGGIRTQSTTVLDETWMWDGTTWAQLTPATTPAARDGMQMVYSPNCDKAMVFGGATAAAVLGDTETWDGSDWTDEAPASPPGDRFSYAMDYDAARGHVLLYGGSDPFSGPTRYRDTWTWECPGIVASIRHTFGLGQ